jgi:tape measure domain-containing protein
MPRQNTIEIILAARDKASQVTKQAFSTIQSSAKTAMNTLKTASIAAGTALAAVSGVVGKVGINFNAQMEQSLIAWETLLGSAGKAKQTVDELLKLGAQTPFEFEGLDKAAKLLHMAKFEGDQLKNALVAVGNAVSAVGGGQEELEGVAMALFQMSAKGKVSAEEMNQMAERGIPAWELLSEATGKSVRDLMKLSEQGKLFANEAIPAIVEGMNKKFAGSMEKQSKTFNGLMSTLKDNLNMFMGQIMEPAFNRIKEFLPVIIDLINRASDAFAKGGWKGVLQEFLPPSVANAIISGLQTIQETFNNVVSSIRAFWDEHGAGISASVLSTVQAIWNFVSPYLQQIRDFVFQKLAEIKKFWDENGSQILQAVQNAWNVILAVIQYVMPVIQFIIDSVWSSIKGIISGALTAIMGLIKVFAGVFTGDFSKMWEGVKQLFFGSVQLIWNFLNLMFIGKILSVFKSFITTGINLLKSGWTNIINGIKGFGSNILGYFKGLWNSVVGTFNSFKSMGLNIFNSIRATLSMIVQGIKSNIINTFNAVKSTVINIFNNIKSAMTNPIETAKNTILKIINTIKNAFANLKIKIPKFKLPHVSVKMKKGAMGIPYPDFDVDWYDKGGVFYGPQIIGVGEKRPEFVGALDDLKAIVRDVIRDENKNTGAKKITIETPIYLDGYEIARVVFPYIEGMQGNMFNSKMRVSGVKR